MVMHEKLSNLQVYVWVSDISVACHHAWLDVLIVSNHIYIIWLVVFGRLDPRTPLSVLYTKRARGLVFVRLTEYTSRLGPPVT
jgi:hypothetical protein